ncbi:hypothetical protein EDB89DRAFT_557425 [Lactarius sanguifluus]|nr:hypothetical protein EDB89DRAFT_557425 [Lactarius sanguifluus]
MTRTAASAVPICVPHTAVANPAPSPFPSSPPPSPLPPLRHRPLRRGSRGSRCGSGRGRAIAVPLSHHLRAIDIGCRRASCRRAACTTLHASLRGARIGVVVAACGRSPRVGVASVVGIGGAGGGYGRGSRRTLDLEKKNLAENLRRGKVSGSPTPRRHFYFNTSSFNVSTTERTGAFVLFFFPSNYSSNGPLPGIAFARGPPPLLQGQHRRGHAIHHTTTPCPLAHPPAAGLRPIILRYVFFVFCFCVTGPKSPSPPLPPPCSTQARGRRLRPIAMYKSAAPRDDVATLGRALTRPASDDGAGTTASARQRDPDSVGHDGATTTTDHDDAAVL